MKKAANFCLKKILKTSALLFSLIILTATVFTSCENFLKGGQVKDEIMSIIDYNNAPSYLINVEALKGSGTIKTPVTGEVEKKVTDIFSIRFEPSDDYKFIKWEAVVQDLGAGEKASDYIEFENAADLETKVTFKKASSKVIVIRPVCPQRLTFSFEQDSGELYPRDTPLVFTFNHSLAQECSVTSDSLIIQNMEETEASSSYFSSPIINDNKIIFASDTSNGYLPIPASGQRAISVKIPKEKLWYLCDLYNEPVKVYLDADLNKTCFVNNETSAKLKIKYAVRQKDETPLGILKINGEEVNSKIQEYSVGTSIAVKYKLPDNYTFNHWTYLDDNGTPVSDESLKLLAVYEDNADTYGYDAVTNTAQMTLKVYDTMEQTVTLAPQIYDPVKIMISKGIDEAANFKVGDLLLTQANTEFDCGIGKVLSLKYKYSDSYKFYGWKIKYGNEDVAFNAQALNAINLSYSYDDNAETNGLNSQIYTAQISIKVTGYIDGVITITPDIRTIPVAEINIDGENGDLSPVKGTYNVKEGFVTSISFDTSDEYGFVCWKVYNAQTEKELTNQNFITFADAYKEKTSYTLINAPQDGTKLLIKPYIVERPHVLSHWPEYDAEKGSRSDTTIEVVFDRDIDINSIFYTDPEIQEHQHRGRTLKESSVYKNRYYGYEEDGEVYLKNIQIVSKRDNENLAKYFGEPTLEDPVTLFIPVEQPDKLKAGMIIIVNISNDFFYYMEDVPISMKDSERWRYLSNGKKDSGRPAVSDGEDGDSIIFKVSDFSYDVDVKGIAESMINGDTVDWALLTSNGHFISDASSVNITLDNVYVTDSLSYPTTMFTFIYKRLYDEHYVKLDAPKVITKTIDYDYALGTEAKYSGTEELGALPDGIYSVEYRFRDRSGNIRTLPDNGAPNDSSEDSTATIIDKAFYFVVDTHGPDLNGNISEVIDSRGTESVTIAVPALVWQSNDVKTAKLKYRLSGSSETYSEKTITSFGSNIQLTGLQTGKAYEIVAELEDYSGKTSSSQITAKTKPAAPQNLTFTDVTQDTISLSWDAPASNNFENYKLYYKTADAGTYSSKTVAKDTTSYELTGLSARTKFDIYIVTESNGIQSDKSIIASAPITKPGAATITNMKALHKNYKNAFEITWTKPTSASYDTLTLYISKSSDFSSSGSFEISNQSSKFEINSIKGADLEFETLYYTKIVSSATVDGRVVTSESVVRRNYSWLHTFLSNEIDHDSSKTTESTIGLKWRDQDHDQNSGIYLNYAEQTQQIERSSLTHKAGYVYYTVTDLTPDTEYTINIKRYRITDGNVSESNYEQFVPIKTCQPPVTGFTVERNTETFDFNWHNPKDCNYAAIKLWAVKEGKNPVLLAVPEITINGTNNPTSCSVNILDVTSKVNGSFYFALTIYEEGKDYGSSAYIPYSLPVKVTGLKCIREYDSSNTNNPVTISFNKIDGDDIYYKIYYSLGNNSSSMTALSNLYSNSNADFQPDIIRINLTMTNTEKLNIMVAVVDSEGNPYDDADLEDVSVSVAIPLPNVKASNVRINATLRKISWTNPSSGDYDGVFVNAGFKIREVFVPKTASSLEYLEYQDNKPTSATVFTCFYGENGALGYNTPGASSN